MEALALGLPVVATRVGGVAELVRDGHEAVLVAPRAARPPRGRVARARERRTPPRRDERVRARRAARRSTRRQRSPRSKPCTARSPADDAHRHRGANGHRDRPSRHPRAAGRFAGLGTRRHVRGVLRVEAPREPVRSLSGVGRDRRRRGRRLPHVPALGVRAPRPAERGARCARSTPRPRPRTRAAGSSAASP